MRFLNVTAERFLNVTAEIHLNLIVVYVVNGFLF